MAKEKKLLATVFELRIEIKLKIKSRIVINMTPKISLSSILKQLTKSSELRASTSHWNEESISNFMQHALIHCGRR